MRQPHWTRHKGDVGDSIVVEVDGVDTDNDGTDDLINVISVTGQVAYAGTLTFPLIASVTDPIGKLVTVQLDPWLADPDTPVGCWALTLDFVFGGGVGPITWPEAGHGEITVE